MEILANKYYPKQMNGSVISAFGQARDDNFSNAETIEDYLYNLSIDTADETELENIGRIIGYVRPLVPEGFESENILIFGTTPIESDFDIGLSTVDSTLGGLLSSVAETETGFMSLGLYRKFLKSMAILKRYGVTLYSIDQIVSLVDSDYTIKWDENSDIVVQFNNSIGYKNIWVLTKIFYKIATEPQVLITSGSDEEEE